MEAVETNARRVALRVSGAALLLAIAKLVVGLAAGSIAVLSSALDSAGDSIASFANFIFLTVAAKPPDDDHHFGHGKAEHLAALLQGVIILAGGVVVGISAIRRIQTPQPVEASGVAIATMLLSMAVTVVLTTYLKRNAVKADSAALAGDALHYTSDLVANGATIVALVLVKITANPLFDSILGVTVAAWIAWNALYLIWNAGGDLMDPALPEDEIAAIIDLIEASDPNVVGHRELRTRRAAGMRFVEFELMIDRSVSFDKAHEVTELVKARIHERFPRAMIAVHAEPVDKTIPFSVRGPRKRHAPERRT